MMIFVKLYMEKLVIAGIIQEFQHQLCLEDMAGNHILGEEEGVRANGVFH